MTKLSVEKLNFGDWPVAQEYLVEVGRLALVWSRLETFVYNSVANLAGFDNLDDPRLYTILTSRRFDENLKLLAQLCRQQLGEMPNLKNYEKVLEKLHRAETNKILYLNSSMRPSPVSNDVEITVLIDEVSGKMEHKKVEIADLKRATLQIDDTQHELYKLICAMERPTRIIKKYKAKQLC